MNPTSLLKLLQLTNSSLPVGAYNYSEGLETLIDQGIIRESESLNNWLKQELISGAIRIETAVLLRAYQATKLNNLEAINYWNNWLSASRETEELRLQSWQMGRTVLQLFAALEPQQKPLLSNCKSPFNYAVAWGLIAALWELDAESVSLGYLSSWVNNLITVGVKLIPLGQTQGQQIWQAVTPIITQVSPEILALEDENLFSCNWGMSLASMNHETLYSRLFRS
jgi:urease accessory protein